MVFIFALLFSVTTFAQRSTFVSAVDRDLTIKTISVAPMVDNVSDIYASPLSAYLNSLVAHDKMWSLKAYPKDFHFTPEQYEDKPEYVKSFMKKSGADALLTSRLSKGPNGISIKLNLFVGKDGLLLSQQTLNDFSGFEIIDLKTQIDALYASLKQKLPYHGTVLSRKGLMVTVDLGFNQGLHDDADLSVIQILKITRHPRFKFVISDEKEILGKIKLKKVEENLSFGTILSEKEEGSIQPGQKFIVDNNVRYPENPLTADNKVLDPMAFGEKSKEWVPEKTPTYGKVGLFIGLGTYSISNNLSVAGGVAATNSFIPSIQGIGEMWLNPEWFLNFSLRQFVFSISNPYPNSTPSKLNVSTSQYTLQGGYNFLLANQFFGPKIQILTGYSKFTSIVDGSTPLAFTNQTYSGILFGLGGSFPLSLESKIPLSLGARLNLFWNPSLDESPTSGNPSNNITSFSAFGEYRYSQKLNLKAVMDYDLFSSRFTGSGSRTTDSGTSSSHTITTVSGGIEYFF